MKTKLLVLSIIFALVSQNTFSGTSGFGVSTFVTHVTCYGNSTGSITASVSGGVGPYKYQWSNGTVDNTSSSTSTISNLKAGIYNVKVTDLGTGLTAFDIATVTQPNKLTSSVNPTDVLCKGDATGSADLSVNGGSGQYTYSWSNGDKSQNLSNVKAGRYGVLISDKNNPSCNITDSVTINEPTFKLSYIVEMEDVSCYNGSNGSIDLSIQGGTPPYKYSWNSGTYKTADIDGLSAGNYSFNVEDANGCKINDQVQINQPTQLTNSVSGTDIQCYGSAEGEVTQSVSGGTPPYKYEWWNSSFKTSLNTKNIKDLPADKYKVRVTDANNCTTMDSTVITSPTQLESSIQGEDITFFGGSDGSIDLTVSGGVKPYSYIWSNGSSVEDQKDVPAGKYTVNIVDFNNCSIKDSITLYEPVTALRMSHHKKHVSCFGGDDGWIEVFAKGGKPPYEFNWANGEKLARIINLTAGTYKIQVIDQNGISISDSIEITQPTKINATAKITHNRCHGFYDGAIDITVDGGTGPYTYVWRDSDYLMSATTQDIKNLPMDTYTVYITDSTLCQNSFSYSIHQPTPMSITTESTDAPCFGGKTGSIEIEVNGGVLPYDFKWDNGETTEDLDAAFAGIHTVTVTDSHACVIMATDTINQMDTISFRQQVTDASCVDKKDGRIRIFDVQGGNGQYSYKWSTGATTTQISGLDNGSYSITVTDLLGCTTSRKIYVDEMPVECISIPNAFTPNGDGMNDTWIIRNSGLYPGCVLQVFNRWGKLVFESSKGYPEAWDGTYEGELLPAGTYYYIFTVNETIAPKKGMITIVR